VIAVCGAIAFCRKKSVQSCKAENRRFFLKLKIGISGRPALLLKVKDRYFRKTGTSLFFSIPLFARRVKPRGTAPCGAAG